MLFSAEPRATQCNCHRPRLVRWGNSPPPTSGVCVCSDVRKFAAYASTPFPDAGGSSQRLCSPSCRTFRGGFTQRPGRVNAPSRLALDEYESQPVAFTPAVRGSPVRLPVCASVASGLSYRRACLHGTGQHACYGWSQPRPHQDLPTPLRVRLFASGKATPHPSSASACQHVFYERQTEDRKLRSTGCPCVLVGSGLWPNGVRRLIRLQDAKSPRHAPALRNGACTFQAYELRSSGPTRCKHL